MKGKEVYRVSRQQLKWLSIKSMNDWDLVIVDKRYVIHVVSYGYSNPALETWVTKYESLVPLSCTPWVRGWRPYYIDKFIHNNYISAN